MTRKWKVTFEGEEPGTADDFILSFTDMRDVVGNFWALKEKVIELLAELVDRHENYHAIGNIKDVATPGEEEVDVGAVWALLGIDKDDLRFGFLLVAIKEGTLLVGLWPEPYAEAAKENSRLIGGVIAAMLERPDNWKRVDVVLPIK